MESFVIIGNSWDASRDNPTSKHQVALTLGRVGHKVLWVDGAGMRRPSLGSGGDRSKMASKLRRGIRPAYQVAENIWRISPLILPFPGVGAVRWLNERIYIDAIRRAVRRIGLTEPVLINFLPTVPALLAKWSIKNRELRDPSDSPPAGVAVRRTSCENAGLGEDHRPEREGDYFTPASPEARVSETAEESKCKNSGPSHTTGHGTDSCAAAQASGRVCHPRGGEKGGQVSFPSISNGDLISCGKQEDESPSSLRTRELERGNAGVKESSGFGTARVRCVYYCVDRWDQFGAYDSGLMERLDAECCRNADLVIASAQDLYERCRQHNENTVLLPHGVDHAHFARGGSMGQEAGGRGQGDGEKIDHRRKTEDGRQKSEVGSQRSEDGKTVRRERIRLWRKDPTTQQPDNLATADAAPRRIGFFGLIDERMDIDLMIALAEKIDNCELVLAGKADGNADRLAGVQNIRMIGSVPYSDLPELIATFDVCIIPYKVNELTKAINPIKLREMLAAGCPVVSTALPEVEKLAREMPEGAVMVAGSNDEFVECVRRILDAPPTLEDRKRISDSVKDQDWSAKVEEILELLNRSRE